MGPADAVRTCLSKYTTFAGRATRPEYWWFFLAGIVVIIVAEILDAVTRTFVFALLVGLALILPQIAVTVRRLHDTGRSGWWYFIALIPIIGSIWLIVLLASQGSGAPNEYGDPPAPALPGYGAA